MTDVKELMAKVGKIRILTNRLIDDQLAGDYHSTFKGQGVEFDEVRPYQVGDDVFCRVRAHLGVAKRHLLRCRRADVIFLHDAAAKRRYHHKAERQHNKHRHRERYELCPAHALAAAFSVLSFACAQGVFLRLRR